MGSAFVAIQNRRATLGARINWTESGHGNVAVLDGGQLWIDVNRLCTVCHSISASADQPLLEFECASGSERLLVYPDSHRRQDAVREILDQIESIEDSVQIVEAARWLDDLPRQAPIAPPHPSTTDSSNCPPYASGTSLRAHMVTAFAEWKKTIRVSSIDFLEELMIVRDRDCVAYCPRISDPGDHHFSLGPA